MVTNVIHSETPKLTKEEYVKRIKEVFQHGALQNAPYLGGSELVQHDEDGRSLYENLFIMFKAMHGFMCAVERLDAPSETEQAKKNPPPAPQPARPEPPPKPSIPSPYLDAQQAAEYLGMTVKALYGHVDRRKLRPLPGYRLYRFTKEQLDAFLRGEKPK